MASVRVRHTLGVLCCLFVLAAHATGSASQRVAEVEALARKGSFPQAFAQSRVVVLAPSLDDLPQLSAIFAKYPQIQQAGISTIRDLIDRARTEQDLLGAQSELRFFVKLVKFALCEPGVLMDLQSRFVTAASRLILNDGIPVTFESNLLAEWTASTGSALDDALERRIYQNTMTNIAARDPRDTPSVLMTDRLFRYLLSEPKAREEAAAVIQRVRWDARDLDGPMRYVYPELVKARRSELGLPESSTPTQNEVHQLDSSTGAKWQLPPSVGTGEKQFGEALQFDTKGVEFGPWVRRFLAQVRRNWFIPHAAMSQRGHVSVSFNVHKDGTITDIVVAAPCAIDAFNNSSSDAVAASSPTVPLPPEYPDEKALVTITFYYNETPGQK